MQIVDKTLLCGKSSPAIEHGFYTRLAQAAFCGALN